VASLSQGRTAAAQCGLFTHKSVPVIFEPPCSISYSSPAFHGTEFQSPERRIKTERLDFVLSGMQLIKGSGETRLARPHPNFNCVLTCEMTLKCWVGREHCTVKAK